MNALAETRRMKRDVAKLYKKYKGKHGLPLITELSEREKIMVAELEKNGLSVSVERIADNRTPEEIYGYLGEYYVGGVEDKGSILDHNSASGEESYIRGLDLSGVVDNGKLKQPSLWLHWVLNEDGDKLEWNGAEKFYYYIEWLRYLIQHFFEPWGIKLNGKVEWQGEESNDFGMISVKDNVVKIYQGKKQYVGLDDEE